MSVDAVMGEIDSQDGRIQFIEGEWSGSGINTSTVIRGIGPCPNGLFSPRTSLEARRLGMPFKSSITVGTQEGEHVAGVQTCVTDDGPCGEKIEFPVLRPHEFKTDLELLYHEVDERDVAEFARDLRVLLDHHVKKLERHGDYYEDLKQDMTANLFNPPVSHFGRVQAVMTELRKMEAILRAIYGGNLDDTNHGQDQGPQTVSAGQQPGFSWPPNTNYLFLSNLMRRSIDLVHTLPSHMIEIADYCFAQHPEFSNKDPLFFDGHSTLVERGHMQSMFESLTVQPVVVNAWAKVIMLKWTHNVRTDRVCLPVAIKEKLPLTPIEMADRWITWMVSCQHSVDTYKQAEMVFIPIYMQYQYCMVVLDVKEMIINFVDTRNNTDMKIWHSFVDLVVQFFALFMEKLGDKRKFGRDKWTFRVWYPRWRKIGQDNESGLSTMHIFDAYGRGGAWSMESTMRQPSTLFQLRVGYSYGLVLSAINVYRGAVLNAVGDIAQRKANWAIIPYEDTSKYVSLRQWIPTLMR